MSPAPAFKPDTCRLLVSVRSAQEARIAVDGGADIVDVKDPSRGPLGMADPAVWRKVLAAVGRRVPVTAALGELLDWQTDLAPSPPQRLPALPPGVWLVKVGLAACAPVDWPQPWRALRSLAFPAAQAVEQFDESALVRSTAPGWVAVAYADWQRAAAPCIEEVARFAVAEPCRALLLDTWQKDGTTLLDWVPLNTLARLCRDLQARGVLVALAGSLGRKHIADLLPLHPDVIAVRGAACQRGRRGAAIDLSRVKQLSRIVHEDWNRETQRTQRKNRIPTPSRRPGHGGNLPPLPQGLVSFIIQST